MDTGQKSTVYEFIDDVFSLGIQQPVILPGGNPIRSSQDFA